MVARWGALHRGMRTLRAWVAVGLVAVAAALASAPNSVAASPYWRAPFYELGLAQTDGGLTLADGTALRGTGIRLFEHSGLITPLTIGLPYAILRGMTIQERKVTGVTKVYSGQDRIEQRTKCEGVGRDRTCTDYVVQERRQLTDIIVHSVPLPPEVVAAQYAAANREFVGILGLSAHFDLTYFPNRDDGSLHGTRVAWYLLTWRPGNKLFELATGYQYERLRAETEDGSGVATKYVRRAHAIPIMLTLRPAPWIYGTVEFAGNILQAKDLFKGVDVDAPGAEDHRSTARASLTLGIPRRVPWLHRIYVRGGVERSLWRRGDGWGTFLEGGLRF